VDEAAIRYWKRFEEETGEHPGARSVGQWLGESEREGPWGILVITDRSLRFRHMPSDNWLNRLFRPREVEETGAGPTEIVVPLSSITALRDPDRGLWARLFGPRQTLFKVTWTDDERARTESFNADSRRFVEALREALGSPVPEMRKERRAANE